MSAHTPGPWKAEFEKGIGHVVKSVKYDLIIAVMQGDDEDARLIAAAPEMLEALKQVEASGLLDRDWSLSNLVGAAIANARGRES